MLLISKSVRLGVTAMIAWLPAGSTNGGMWRRRSMVTSGYMYAPVRHRTMGSTTTPRSALRKLKSISFVLQARECQSSQLACPKERVFSILFKYLRAISCLDLAYRNVNSEDKNDVTEDCNLNTALYLPGRGSLGPSLSSVSHSYVKQKASFA